MDAGPVSNNPSVNVVPGADQSSNDALQGAKVIHRVSKDAAEGSGYLCVTWKNWVINKLGQPLGYLALIPSLPLVAVLDGISSLASGVRLLFRKITRTESVVKKLPPMAEKQVADVEKLTQKNAELSNEIAARKIEADQLNSSKAHADQQLGQLQQQNNQLGYRVAQQQNDNVQVAARAEIAEKQAAAMNGQLRQLQQENGQLGHQMIQLQNEKTEAAARAGSAESRVSSLTKATEQFNRERSELALKLQRSQAAFDAQLADKELHIQWLTEGLDTAHQRFRDVHAGDHRAKEKLTGEIRSLKEQLATHQNQARVLGQKHQNQMRDLEIRKDTMMQELRAEITSLKEAKQRGECKYNRTINDLQSRMSAQQELIAHHSEQEQVKNHVNAELQLRQQLEDTQEQPISRVQELEAQKKVDIDTIEGLKGKVVATESTVRKLARKLTATENTVKTIGRKKRLLTVQNTALKKQADTLSREVEADTQRFASLEYATTGERSERPDKERVKELTKSHVHDGRLAMIDLANLRAQVDGKDEELHVKLTENAALGWENAALATDIERLLNKSSKTQEELDKALKAQSDLQFQFDELTVEMEEQRRYTVAKPDPNGDAWPRPEQFHSANNAGLLTVKH